MVFPVLLWALFRLMRRGAVFGTLAALAVVSLGASVWGRAG